MEKNILSLSPLNFLHLLFILHFLTVNVTEGTRKDDQYRTLCAAPGFDYFNLTALPWFISAEPPSCLPLPVPDAPLSERQNISKCLILMRFCRTLEHFGIGCVNSSVCQQSTQGDVSLGAYKDNPFVGSNASRNGFEAALSKGVPYRTTDGRPCEVKTIVSFHCNPAVKWEAPSTYIGIKRAPDPRSVVYNADTCEIKLSFDYAGACKTDKYGGGNSLSIGSVILIVFTVSFVLYLILGLLVNAAKGKSGSKLIPDVEMWSSLIGFISDGVNLTCCPGIKPVRAVAYEEIKDVAE